MAQGRIEIKFEPKGDKALIRAIKQLDIVTKRLKGTTSIYERELKQLELQQKKNNKATFLGVRNLRNMGKGTTRLLPKLSVLRSKLLIVSFAIGMVSVAFKKLFDKMIEQEKAEKKLEAAIGKNTKALINQAAALQQVTVFGDEAIINAQALIGAYTDDEEALKKATEATLDLAAAKGMDLNTAADLVGKSLGSSTNALARYGVEVTGVVGSAKRLESLTTNVSRVVEQLKNAFGDANEILGDAFAPAIKLMAKQMKEGAEAAGDWIRNLTMDDLEKTILQVEKLGGNADSLRLILAKSKLEDITPQLKGVENLDALQKKLLKNTDDQINKNKQVGHEYHEVSLIQSEINKLQDEAGKNPNFLKWRDLIIGGKWQKLLDDRQGFDRDAERSKIFQATKDLELIEAAKEKVVLSQKEGKTIEELIELRKKEEILMAEIERLQARIASGGEDPEVSFFERIFGAFGDPAKMQEIHDQVAMWSNAVMNIANEYQNVMQAQLDSSKQTELNAANDIKWEKKRQKQIENINKKYEKEQQKLNKEAKRIKRAQTVINTAVAITEVLSDKNITSTFAKIAMVSFVSMLGGLQLKTIDAQKYQYGGLVGGNRHSQGGTMIEAERGEFVISRRGVEAAGIEALNRINAGMGGGTVNITFAGNIMSKDFIEDEAIPQIREAIRRGADIGVN